MSAERGWIGEPQPPREWHMPAWVTAVEQCRARKAKSGTSQKKPESGQMPSSSHPTTRL
jgi:hypothetical protein